MAHDLLAELAPQDKDRYLSLLFAPAPLQPHLAALYLFNVELGRIQHLVSDPHIGAIRFQWWREAVDRLYSGAGPDHPVARSLAPVIAQSGIPSEGLLAMIDAHEQAFEKTSPDSLEELERHLGKSSSMLMQLAVLVLGGSAPETAGLAGVAYGLARLLHGSDRWFVPAAMRTELGDEVALNTLAGHAQRRLIEARKTSFANNLLPAFLPAATASLYLAAFNASPSSPRPVSQLRRQVTIWWAGRRNRF